MTSNAARTASSTTPSATRCGRCSAWRRRSATRTGRWRPTRSRSSSPSSPARTSRSAGCTTCPACGPTPTSWSAARRGRPAAAARLQPAAPHRVRPPARPGLEPDRAAPPGRVQPQPPARVPRRRGAGLRLRVPVRAVLRVVPPRGRRAPPPARRARDDGADYPDVRANTVASSRWATTSGCWRSRPMSPPDRGPDAAPARVRDAPARARGGAVLHRRPRRGRRPPRPPALTPEWAQLARAAVRLPAQTPRVGAVCPRRTPSGRRLLAQRGTGGGAPASYSHEDRPGPSWRCSPSPPAAPTTAPARPIRQVTRRRPAPPATCQPRSPPRVAQ